MTVRNKESCYDIVFIGNYTKDTIVSASGTRLVDGGGFNYGAQAAARMGLKVAAVTRLAQEDWRVVDGLRALGVDVFAQATPRSTCLRLEYPTSDPDQRTIYVTSTAGSYMPEQVDGLTARAYAVNPSFRGEVGLELLQGLRSQPAKLALDVQGFVRVVREGVLRYEPWPEMEQVLPLLDVLKTDAAEAEKLTGQADKSLAARILSDMGPSEVVLTHRDGLLVYAAGQYYEARFCPRELVGRSGRGDTCLASYLARRLTHPPADATLWAAALTSLKMEAEGPFNLGLDQVDDLLRRMALEREGTRL